MADDSKDLWKSFEGNQLTHSAAHYLMAIKELHEEQGYARVTDVARRLNITRGSCSLSLKALRQRGLVEEDHNRFLLLSEEGDQLARIVETNDQLLETLFRDILGVDPEQAEIDACKIEHLISIDTSLRLHALIRYLQSGEPAVSAFREGFKTFSETPCPKDSAVCEFCVDACLLNQDDDEASG